MRWISESSVAPQEKSLRNIRGAYGTSFGGFCSACGASYFEKALCINPRQSIRISHDKKLNLKLYT
jgi:hypothetical protein